MSLRNSRRVTTFLFQIVRLNTIKCKESIAKKRCFVASHISSSRMLFANKRNRGPDTSSNKEKLLSILGFILACGLIGGLGALIYGRFEDLSIADWSKSFLTRPSETDSFWHYWWCCCYWCFNPSDCSSPLNLLLLFEKHGYQCPYERTGRFCSPRPSESTPAPKTAPTIQSGKDDFAWNHRHFG